MLTELKFSEADENISVSTDAYIHILLFDIGLVPDVVSSKDVTESHYAW